MASLLRNLFSFVMYLFVCHYVVAQDRLASLTAIWQDAEQTDSVRVQALEDLIWDYFLFTQPDTSIALGLQMVAFSEQGNYPKGRSMAHNVLGNAYQFIGDFKESLINFEKSLAIEYERNDSVKVASRLANIGSLYSDQGMQIKGLEYWEKSLAISQKIGSMRVIGHLMLKIGLFHRFQGDHDKALEYYFRGMDIYTEIDNERAMIPLLNDMGLIYRMKGEFGKAREYMDRSLAISRKFEDQLGTSNSYMFLGDVSFDENDMNTALAYYDSAQTYAGNNIIASAILARIGDLNREQGKYQQGIEACEKAHRMAVDKGEAADQQAACECLLNSYKATGNYKEALRYSEIFEAIEDSLRGSETIKKLQRFEFEKQAMADSLVREEEKLRVEMDHQAEVAEKEKARNLFLGGGLLLLLLAAGLYSRMRYTRKAKDRIEKEKERSDELLLNILPEEIAAELKEKGAAEAKLIDHVTVLFTDFKGFTSMAEKLSPKELVHDLNVCFSEFDRIMQKYGIEKIKTIGDAYMAAGGLPTPNNTHATDVIQAVFEMRDFVAAGKAKKIEKGLPYFEIRIGVHTGPVVAGIVGVKKFAYDIWGDTVNTASRMESSGEVGQVNISDTTYGLVKDETQFSFESRGKIEAKGKGEMQMWFVQERT